MDIDKDGKLDIHYVSIDLLGKFDLGILKNTGNDTFTKVENTGIYAIGGDLGNLTANTAKWADFDGDGLKDVIFLKIISKSNHSTKIHNQTHR